MGISILVYSGYIERAPKSLITRHDMDSMDMDSMDADVPTLCCQVISSHYIDFVKWGYSYLP